MYHTSAELRDRARQEAKKQLLQIAAEFEEEATNVERQGTFEDGYRGKSELTDETPGLGITIIGALAKQLGAKVDVISTDTGLSVSLTHAIFKSRMPRAS